MRKLIPFLVLSFAAFALAQDGPLTNGANLPVRTDTNGYLLAASQTYTGPDGPRRVWANTLVRTDANGYLIVTNPTGFGSPLDAQYWVGAANASLTAEKNLGALSTGLVINTAGVPSIYAGVTCLAGTAIRVLDASGAGTCASAGGMEIGGTITSATQGSVLFAGASGVLAQDNANLFWDDTTNTLELRGGDATESLEIHSAYALGAAFYTHAAAAFRAPAIDFRRSRGTEAAPTAISSGDHLSYLTFSGYGTTGYVGGANIEVVALENFTDSASGTRIDFKASKVGSASVGPFVYVSPSATEAVRVLQGDLTLSLDNAHDLGQDGVFRPRNAWIGTKTVIGGTRNLLTTSSDGDVLQNTTPATALAELQYSPRTRWSGTGWDYDDLVSRTIQFFAEVQPTGGTTVRGNWRVGYIDPTAGTISYPLTLTSVGGLTLTGLVTGESLTAGAGGYIYWTGRSEMTAPADGQIRMRNAAQTEGANLMLGTGSFPSTGTSSLIFSDGTIPATMGSNTAGLYADDVGGTVKPHAIDEAGNTQRLVTPQTIQFAAVLFASLPTTNGAVSYCSDCTIANPCAGAGTGAIAKRLNGINVCN